MREDKVKVIANRKKKIKGRAVLPSPLETGKSMITCFPILGYHEIIEDVITVLSSQS